LRSEAAALRLENVTFAGRVPPSEIHRYYADADIYVQAPSIDNMPLSVLEAFASGLPVVSTNVGGIPSILRDRIDGLLVDDNDAVSLANQIINLLSDPAFARQLAQSAHETLSAYHWSVARDGWLEAYRRALRGSNGDASEHAVESTPFNPA
jgi:glycosyltransferase involved in cell wall biosynthesis